MATTNNNVWSMMNYTPPRGPCNVKTSLVSPACSCLRFMLHPLKANSSFECDGCGHHASFHALENPAEEAVLIKWADASVEVDEPRIRALVPAPKKRKLLPSTTNTGS